MILVNAVGITVPGSPVADLSGLSPRELSPGAEFRLLPRAGHLPQIETPELLLGQVRDFAEKS